MNAGFSKLSDALDQLLVRYEKWEEPLQRYIAENFVRVNKDGYTWEMFERGLLELKVSLTAEYDPYAELHVLLERLCLSYLGCDFDERAQIRAFVVERKQLGRLVLNYANHLVTQINRSEDAQILRIALAAVSIENCGSDCRDTLMTLADLYVRAEEVGIDPKQGFEAVGELSANTPTTGGCESLADTLRQFESYAMLRERRKRGRYYWEWI